MAPNDMERAGLGQVAARGVRHLDGTTRAAPRGTTCGRPSVALLLRGAGRSLTEAAAAAATSVAAAAAAAAAGGTPSIAAAAAPRTVGWQQSRIHYREVHA